MATSSGLNVKPFLITVPGIFLSLICGASLGLGKTLFWDPIEVNDHEKQKQIITKRVIGGMASNLGLYLVVPNSIRLMWLWPLVEP